MRRTTTDQRLTAFCEKRCSVRVPRCPRLGTSERMLPAPWDGGPSLSSLSPLPGEGAQGTDYSVDNTGSGVSKRRLVQTSVEKSVHPAAALLWSLTRCCCVLPSLKREHWGAEPTLAAEGPRRETRHFQSDWKLSRKNDKCSGTILWPPLNDKSLIIKCCFW